MMMPAKIARKALRVSIILGRVQEIESFLQAQPQVIVALTVQEILDGTLRRAGVIGD